MKFHSENSGKGLPACVKGFGENLKHFEEHESRKKRTKYF